MGIKAIRKALKGKATDDFEVGDVVRWTSAERYTYAAIKTEVGWFTTARVHNTFVEQVIDFDELLEILARSETTDVMVATEWEVV